MQVPPSFSEKSDVSSKEIKERSKSKNKKKNIQNELIDLIEDKDIKPQEEKEKKKEIFTTKVPTTPQNQNSNSISSSGSAVPNYNQQFFDYKSFKAPTKRKNSNTDTLMIKKSKKHSNTWIKKESNKPKKISPPKSNIQLEIDSVSMKSGFSEDLAIDINKAINENKEIKKEPSIISEIKEEKEPINSSQSSFNSLEFNSRVQSKVKQNNFEDKPKPTNPTSAYAAFIREKKPLPRQRASVIEGINNQMNELNAKAVNKNDISLDIKPIEEVNTYDEFYQLKRGKKNSLNNRRSLPLGVGRNVKIKIDKKEREKMAGHKCELCQKFYETLGENPDTLCEECSRHRTDQKPSSTPKGFYDLTI